MSSYFLKMFYALLLLLLYNAGSILGFNWPSKNAEVKCVERERQALLKFKQGLLDDSGMLSTWRDNHNNTDCCKWKGVECSNKTGHVQMLDLHSWDTNYLEGAINVTLLIDLQNIEHLDLSGNYFGGSHIPELIGLFTKLRYLNLSYSVFGGRIPYQLGNLLQLEYLNLSYNDLYGAIPSQLGKLTHLQYLDLSNNDNIDGEIPSQLGNLSQLRYLDLGGNYLSGAIPFQIGNFPMLETLRLNGNFDLKINDAEWLSTLSSLTTLGLSSKRNLGSSHHWLQIISKLLPNLRELRLTGCNLFDNDIISLFDSYSNFFTSLTILDLSSNMLTSSTFQLLINFPSLVILDLSYNKLTSSVFQGNFNFGSKLQELHLSNCSLMDGSFHVSSAPIMNSSSSLVILDLFDNLLTSSAIFHWVFNFTTNLHSLYLSDNLLEGPIPNEFGKVMNSLEFLYLYNNKLQGEIPAFFGNMCTLQTLSLSNNNLSGEISSFIQNSTWCNRHIFQALYLSNNRITGLLPKSIGLLYELEALYLDGNSLKGDITESHLTNFSKLKYLRLSDNSLSLKFVPSWVPPFQLRRLEIASCKLGPRFPSWLQTQSSLFYLNISILQYMTVMDMSHNNLTGTIPNLPLKFTFKPGIFLNSNQFEGVVPSFLQKASALGLSKNRFSNLDAFLCGIQGTENLATLDLSNNQIKGRLPDCWKSVNSLLFLDLSNNKLSGKIPLSMDTLINLEALVLRSNSLIGELPSTLMNCTNLIMLDVGENMLSGPIPSWIGESLRQLIILRMPVNHFSGNLFSHICYLRQIQVLDLSKNNLSKGIPTCLNNFSAMAEKRINRSEISSHIYWFNTTYYEIYGAYSTLYYVLNITLMWKGVEYGFKNPELLLKSIDLSNNHLTGEIPKEFGYLLGLVSLNLSRNNLSGEIPSEIGNLNSLDFLDLSRNNFSGTIPSSLSQIDRLALLDLSNNSLSGKIPLGTQL